jgi:signal transduction histidine kinase
MTAASGPPSAAVERERRRLAAQLHGGVVQQVTALALAVDSALLHHADGDAPAVEAALRSARAAADAAVSDCRQLIDGLQGHA